MRKKILVINRDEELFQGIRLNLEEIADVIALESTEGLDRTVAEKGVDYILMDSDLLDEPGISALYSVKMKHPNLGLVVMQLYGEEAQDAGKNLMNIVDMFVYKPVDFTMLTHRLNLPVRGMT